MDSETEKGVLGFEEKHLIAIMMFLSINGECQKIEIYKTMGHSEMTVLLFLQTHR